MIDRMEYILDLLLLPADICRVVLVKAYSHLHVFNAQT